MLNSSGLEVLALAELGEEFDPEQPSANMIAARATVPKNRRGLKMLNVMAGFSFQPLLSIVQEQSYMKPAPGDKLIEWNGNCARRRDSPKGWRRRVYKHIR